MRVNAQSMPSSEVPDIRPRINTSLSPALRSDWHVRSDLEAGSMRACIVYCTETKTCPPTAACRSDDNPVAGKSA